MRLITVVLSSILFLSACEKSPTSTEASDVSKTPAKTEQSEKSESERLNAWFDTKYQEELQFSPIALSFLGKKEKYDQIDSMTEAAAMEQLKWRKQTVEALEANFDYAKLSDDAKLSYDLWKYQYEREKAEVEFLGQAYVFHQMNGVQAFLPQFLINFHKVDTPSDMDAYIARIDEVARALNELLDRAQKYAQNGIRPPKFAYEGVLEQAGNIISGKPFDEAEDSPLWADAKTKIASLVAAEKIDEEAAQKYREQTKAALLGKLKTAYNDLIAWVEKDMPNADLVATGVGKRENGADYYNYRLAASTTTSMTAEQVHALGKQEVERLTKEMKTIKNKVGFEGSLQDFFVHIKEGDEFYYPNTDEGRQGYIDDSKNYLAFIEKRLPEFFGILPKAKLVVKRVEPFREQDAAAQHYFPGTPDGSRPGVYYAHLSDMRSMPKNEMEAIAYHEGSPGHHMQISIAQELDSVPEFRKQARFTAYSEGWALYSELLAKEMGAYESDYSDFGRLITEIWRAVRLVVDTGLHAKGWTEEEAVKYFKEKSPIAEGAIRSEVRRYLVWPGQATAYKVGMLKILELRAMAEKELGDKFDIRGFHDNVLGGGALPMEMLEKKVKRWVNDVKQESV